MPTLKKPGRRECDTRRQAVHAAQGGGDTHDMAALPQPSRHKCIALGHPWTPSALGNGDVGKLEGWGAGLTAPRPIPPAPLAPIPVLPPCLPFCPPPLPGFFFGQGADLNRLAGSQELIILMQCKMECA